MKFLQGYDTKLVKTKKVKLDIELPIKNQDMAALAAFKILNGADRESILVFFLSNELCGWQEVSKGGSLSASVSMKDLFKAAVHIGANALILVHNHPSGNISPSESDITFTNKAIQAGKILGIHIIDHLIVDTMEKKYLSIIEICKRANV